ncbi:MAG: hypothetical protein ACKVU1_02615 [bacterium]
MKARLIPVLGLVGLAFILLGLPAVTPAARVKANTRLVAKTARELRDCHPLRRPPVGDAILDHFYHENSWPRNPYTRDEMYLHAADADGAPQPRPQMREQTDSVPSWRGDCGYYVAADGAFKVFGYGADGAVLLTLTETPENLGKAPQF